MKKLSLLTTFALALCLCAGTALAQEFEFETGPQELEDSAGWGIDLDTGKVAVDAGLIYFLDAVNSTFVINPKLADQAIEDLGATVLDDGRWEVEGETYTPVLAELVIDSGREPEELFEYARLPRVAYERVNVVNDIGEGALKARAFRRCRDCRATTCPFNGLCQGNTQYSNLANPARPGECKFALFRTCRQRYEPICNVTYFQCLGCNGGVTGTNQLLLWACYDC